MNVASPIPKKHARIEIIPLIDIMFFLLASFMMVSLSQVHMKGIKVNLPPGQSGETQSKQNYISLSVDKDGFFYFDKNKITYEDMLPLLQKQHQENPDAKVFVRGDREAIHGNVTRLLDELRSAGFSKIAFEIKSQAASGFPGPGR
jgi:biopolymer transport protein ExbD